MRFNTILVFLTAFLGVFSFYFSPIVARGELGTASGSFELLIVTCLVLQSFQWLSGARFVLPATLFRRFALTMLALTTSGMLIFGIAGYFYDLPIQLTQV